MVGRWVYSSCHPGAHLPAVLVCGHLSGKAPSIQIRLPLCREHTARENWATSWLQVSKENLAQVGSP